MAKCTCSASTAICGCISRGMGILDDNGFWEHPCPHGSAFVPYEADCPTHGKRMCSSCEHPASNHKELRVGGDPNGRLLGVRCDVELLTCWSGPERICRCRDLKIATEKVVN